MKFEKDLSHLEFRICTLYTALSLPSSQTQTLISFCVLLERSNKNIRSGEVLIADTYIRLGVSEFRL